MVYFITWNFGKYDPDSLKGYKSTDGFRALRKALIMEGCDIADVLTAGGVQGQGDAIYGMSGKWRQARKIPGTHKYVVCSADEDGPGTFKDRELLTYNPFQLPEGMIIVGWVVRMDNGYIYLREEYSHLWPRLFSTVTQCEAADYLSESTLNSRLNYRVHLYSSAGAYVCGEGSILAESIGGHAGQPRMKSPPIKQCDVFHLPIYVNNVESPSLVAPLLLDDEGYYKSQDAPDHPSTKMVSMCGNVKRPGVFKVSSDITIREIVCDLAGGMESGDYPLRLVQLGNAPDRVCSPVWLDTLYTHKGMCQADLTAIGSDAVLMVDERTDAIGFLHVTQEFFSYEGCGQCIPCREGSRHISLLPNRITEGTHTAQDIATLKRFVDIVSSVFLCDLDETTQSALLSCAKHFPEVFAVEEEIAVR